MSCSVSHSVNTTTDYAAAAANYTGSLEKMYTCGGNVNTIGCYVKEQTEMIKSQSLLLDAATIATSLFGIYGIIKQHELLRDQQKLAERMVNLSEDYYRLALQNYNCIVKQTYNCTKDYFDRYLNKFSGYECDFVSEAFGKQEYEAEYCAQQGRAMSTVQSNFDHARKQIERSLGKYQVGRSCYVRTNMAISAAKAKTEAANIAYRYEDAKVLQREQWNWKCKQDGINVVGQICNKAMSSLTGAAQVGVAGINASTNALDAFLGSYGQFANAYGQAADFWGGLGRDSLQTSGYLGFDRGAFQSQFNSTFGGQFGNFSGANINYGNNPFNGGITQGSGLYTRNSFTPIGGGNSITPAPYITAPNGSVVDLPTGSFIS